MSAFTNADLRMVDIETVRRVALSLPESEDRSTVAALRFYVRDKQFAWTYQERVHPKRPRQPRLDVLAVRCAAEDKDSLLASDPGKFFTDDHYRGFLRSWSILTALMNKKFGYYSRQLGGARPLRRCDGCRRAR